MSSVEINQVIQQMRNMASLAENKMSVEPGVIGAGTKVAGPDFSQLLKDSINQVNKTQKAAGSLATAFEMGDPSVSLSEVMVARQKSSVSFQALTQVRNNLLSAYKEVMKMQV